MITTSFLLIAIAVACAAFVQGTTGFGFALIVAPVASLIEPGLVPVSLLVLMLPLNLYVAWRERGHVDRKGAGWITAGRVVGTAGGLWLLAASSPSQLGAFVGIATIGAVLLTLGMPAFSPATPAYVASGLVTGITETATGVGGPPLALVYQHQPASVMRSTVAVCFLVGEVISLVILFLARRVDPFHLVAAVELLPFLIVGSAASHLVHRRVNGRFLRAFVLLFASVSGAVLILR